MEIKKSDVAWTYLSKFLMLGINLILLPLIMRYLTDTDLGLWYVFSSISQVVNLFDFGFSATIARHMTYAWSGAKTIEKTHMGEYNQEREKNVELIADIVTTCKLVYLIISSTAIVIMLTAGTTYIYQVTGADMTKRILASWIIYAVAVFWNLFYGYWSSLLQGIGAVAERNKMSVYSKMIQIFLAVVLLSLDEGLLGFVIAYAASGIALRFVGKYFFVINTRELQLKVKAKKVSIQKCFSAIWATAWKDGLVMLAQYLSTQANTLVCAYYVDLSTTSSYGVITQIGSMLGAMAASYYSAYQPQYSNYCLRREKEKLRELTCRCGFVYKIIFVSAFLGFVVLGIPLLKIIRPSMKINLLLVFGVCLFYYLHDQHSMYCSMIASSNRILYYKQFMVTAASSIIVSIFLTAVFHLNVWGLILAQIISNLVFNNWYWPRYVRKEQEIRYTDVFIVGFRTLKEQIKGI